MKKTSKFLMIQGTASHVGKSVIVTALCRIFSNRGVRVAPFKAQNMALNSTVTADGLEIGRSTAVQALAARTELKIEMNPVLLKPKADNIAQLILNGLPYRDVSAKEQFQGDVSIRDLKLGAARQSLDALAEEFELIIIEGAGSPAEVNLRPFDTVNMAIAEWVDAPVILVADVDRGGAIAAIVGTYTLLSENERRLLRGLIINKFRGDPSLFSPAIEFLEEQTHSPVLGVIPFSSELYLMEEDSLPERIMGTGHSQIEIAVVEHQHLSNFTDIDPLTMEPGVRIRYVQSPEGLGQPDAIILPGTKNTVSDLRVHIKSGMAEKITKMAKEGLPVFGICGGYQMLGKVLLDPYHREDDVGNIAGLGLLEVETFFQSGKTTRQVKMEAFGASPFLLNIPETLVGYEIHSGETKALHAKVDPVFSRIQSAQDRVEYEGAVSQNGRVLGSSVHGLFENDIFRRQFINVLRELKGLDQSSEPLIPYYSIVDEKMNHWAKWVEENMDMDQLHKIIQV